MQGKRILLIVGGGIAAYKSLELVRRLKERGASVRAILTKGGAEFVTPLSLSVLTEEKAFTDLFDLKDEAEIGHIRLSREADLIVVAPATADLLAKMAHGLADDLATAVLLAADKQVLAAPAMNVRMWEHPATRRNLATLTGRRYRIRRPRRGRDGVRRVWLRAAWPSRKRSSKPSKVCSAMQISVRSTRAAPLRAASGTLRGRRVLITSGPTQEPIDPVRYIANRSSGKQGHALARAAAALGAEVTLVSGPVALPDPQGVTVVKVETAHEMLAATLAALPADIAICAAAVADWRAADEAPHKLKKQNQVETELKLALNPDILATIAKPGPKRPTSRDRLRRRDREFGRQRGRQAPRQGCGLDRRQRCLARHRRDGRRPHASPPRHGGGRRGLAAAQQGRDRDAAACPRGASAHGHALGG